MARILKIIEELTRLPRTGEYRTIPSIPAYRISPYGEIINKGEMVVKPYLASGYLCIKLKQDKRSTRKTFLVHRLVYEAYVAPLVPKQWINHKDGNKLNNHFENLEQDTPKYNHEHARDTLKRKYIRGSNIGSSRLTEDGVEAIKVLIDAGWSQARIARAFDVTQPCVSFIVTGRSWKQL